MIITMLSSSETRMNAAEELVRGREFARQLGRVLDNSLAHDSSSFTTQDLVMKILDSFSKSLSILNRMDSDEFSTRICIKDSKMKKNSRGCCKRKNTSHSWAMESSSLIDDGYTWRKYGQKVILKAKYHRNYFRCSYKYDEGCLAKKQVQRIEEDPPKFCTTYHGDHTCRIRSSILKVPLLDQQQYSNLYETPNLTDIDRFSVSDYLMPPYYSDN